MPGDTHRSRFGKCAEKKTKVEKDEIVWLRLIESAKRNSRVTFSFIRIAKLWHTHSAKFSTAMSAIQAPATSKLRKMKRKKSFKSPPPSLKLCAERGSTHATLLIWSKVRCKRTLLLFRLFPVDCIYLLFHFFLRFCVWRFVRQRSCRQFDSLSAHLLFVWRRFSSSVRCVLCICSLWLCVSSKAIKTNE